MNQLHHKSISSITALTLIIIIDRQYYSKHSSGDLHAQLVQASMQRIGKCGQREAPFQRGNVSSSILAGDYCMDEDLI
jgi:hypothetical protein